MCHPDESQDPLRTYSACLAGSHTDADRMQNEFARSAEAKEGVEERSDEHPICAQEGIPAGFAPSANGVAPPPGAANEQRLFLLCEMIFVPEQFRHRQSTSTRSGTSCVVKTAGFGYTTDAQPYPVVILTQSGSPKARTFVICPHLTNRWRSRWDLSCAVWRSLVQTGSRLRSTFAQSRPMPRIPRCCCSG